MVLMTTCQVLESIQNTDQGIGCNQLFNLSANVHYVYYIHCSVLAVALVLKVPLKCS